MENQVKTNTDQKEQQLKKISKMSMIRALLPIAGLIIIFLLFNVLTNFRMIGNLPLVLSQVYVTMIAATGVFFIMTMGGLDFSQGSILGIASIVVCMLSKTSIPLAIVLAVLWQAQQSVRSTVTSMYTVRSNPLLLRSVPCSCSVVSSSI